MPLPGEWVVLIASKKGKTHALLGTGTVVAPGRVLTARHVVFNENGSEEPGLVVGGQNQPFRPASIRWSGAPDLDIAVLEADVECAGLQHPLALLSARDIAAEDSWEAQGYAAVRNKNPSERAEKVGGRTRSWGRRDRELTLETPAPPEVWGGLSGAAVFIRSHIVGVVRSEPKGWDRKRLYATPVAAFLDEPGFREALGLKEDPLARELADLEDYIAAVLKTDIEKRERLKTSGALADALADRLGIGDLSSNPAGRIARALIDMPGKDVATILADLDATLDKDRDAVRSLLWQTLPFAVDWRELLLQSRSAIESNKNALELPLRTETLAEIVLAGADGRQCQFSPDGDYPQGVGRIRMPAATLAPFFHTGGERLVEALVLHLCREEDAGDLQWTNLKRRFPKPSELSIVVEKRLRNLARKGAPNRLPHYLLFIDAELEEGKDMEALWGVARAAFGKELPSLRLVRLRGGLKELDEEADVAEQILAVRDRR